MPLDPQVEVLLKEIAAQGKPPLHTLSVGEARSVAEEMINPSVFSSGFR